MRRVAVLVSLVLMIGFAGCAGAPAAKNVATTSSAAPPVVTVDTGAITGIVTDEELVALSKVAVGLAALGDFRTETDAQGAFTLNDVPPGTHTVVAGRLGYESKVVNVDVVAGETVSVKIALKALIIVVPHVEHFVDEGFITFAAAVPSVHVSADAVFGASKTKFERPAEVGAVGVISTGVWDRSAPATATRMTVSIKIADTASGTGITPVTARLFNANLTEAKKIELNFYTQQVCTNGTGCLEDPPNRFAQVVYQQKTYLYTDVYYVTPPEETAVAGPPRA